MKLRILAEAETEAREAARWYEGKQFGLGGDFLIALAESLTAIEREPASFPRLETVRTHREIRRAILRRFPYAVMFEVLPNELLVFAVSHVSRRTAYWRQRLNDLN